MWAKWHMSDTKKGYSHSLSCSKLKVTSIKKKSGFNDNYLELFYMIYIIIWFILLLIHDTQAILV